MLLTDITESQQQIIESKLNKTSEHWIWTGGYVNGSPRTYIGASKGVQARHALYVLHTQQDLPKGARLISTCGHPHCVNPAHMRLRDESRLPSVAERGETDGLRFESAVIRAPGTDCHLWGRSHSGSSPQFYLGGKMVHAQWFAYAYYLAPIPEGIKVEAICGNKSCVNPDHLIVKRTAK